MLLFLKLRPFAKSTTGIRKGSFNNPGQHIIGKVPQVLTIRSESLAARFAAGNNYTRSTKRNRSLSLDERTPNVPFKFGLRFANDLFPVHRSKIAHHSDKCSAMLMEPRRMSTSLGR
jgi:hypothetical protein